MYEFSTQGDRELFDRFCRKERIYPETRIKDAFIVALREARGPQVHAAWNEPGITRVAFSKADVNLIVNSFRALQFLEHTGVIVSTAGPEERLRRERIIEQLQTGAGFFDLPH